MEGTRLQAESPVKFSSVVIAPGAGTCSFDVSIRRLVESHKALYAALATAWGATGGTLTTTITAVCNVTTGDIDLHVAFSTT